MELEGAANRTAVPRYFGRGRSQFAGNRTLVLPGVV
jgi:hypothetical protein